MQQLLSQTIPKGFLETFWYAKDKFGLDGSIARYILFRKAKWSFIHQEGKISKTDRQKLLKQFSIIHHNITCAHNEADYAMIAHMILNSDLKGPIIEFGAFKGGSTAKLSLIAKLSNRHLYVFDSFAGIPAITKEDHSQQNRFEMEDYLGTEEEVRQNIQRYGSIQHTTLIPGFFDKTLPKHTIKPAFVIMDVDLIRSAQTCLQYTWGKTRKGGIWFTHEAELPAYIEGVFDHTWWHKKLKQCPPLVVGAMIGATPATPSMAYFKKNK